MRHSSSSAIIVSMATHLVLRDGTAKNGVVKTLSCPVIPKVNLMKSTQPTTRISQPKYSTTAFGVFNYRLRPCFLPTGRRPQLLPASRTLHSPQPLSSSSFAAAIRASKLIPYRVASTLMTAHRWKGARSYSSLWGRRYKPEPAFWKTARTV